MSRPSKAESEELERLERASGLVAGAQETLEIIALRLRQVQRRVPALAELATAGQAQSGAALEALDEAHGLLSAVLTEKQAARRAKHYKATQTQEDDR